MRRLFLMLALLGSTARAHEPAPPPRLDLTAALAAVLDDLKQGKPKAAHARVGQWVNPMLSDPAAFAGYWERLVRLHGPVRRVELYDPENIPRDKSSAAAFLHFDHVKYLFGGTAVDRRLAVQYFPFPEEQGFGWLLWAGHGVPVTAADPDNPREGTVTFAVPGPYREQVPLRFTVAADPPAALLGWTLKPRADGLNWVCECRVAPGKGGAVVFWEATVLVRPSQPSVAGPATNVTEPEAPAEAAAWLRSTGCIQSADPRVTAVAARLRKKEQTIYEYASVAEDWVRDNPGTGEPFRTLDAAAAVGGGGSCTSRANLCAALLRARGLPARTVAHLPLTAGPHFVHWLTEYWHPGVGWVWKDPAGRFPIHYSDGIAVVLNVSTPTDEDNAIEPNRRSGIMPGAPRLSSRELTGPIRTPFVMTADPRTWGLCVPLTPMAGDDADRDALYAAARQSWVGLARDGAAGRSDPRRAGLTATAQKGGTNRLTAELRELDP